MVDTIASASVNKLDVNENKSANTGGNPDNDPEFAAIPQLGASYAIGDLRLGFGLSIPQGFGSNYGDDWAGRYLADETSLVFISAQPALAYRVTDWLSVGAAVSIMYVSSEVKQNIRSLGEADGRFELDVDGVSAGPLLSVLLEPTATTRVGLAGRGEIEPELDGDPNFRNKGPLLEAALDAAGLRGRSIDIDMRVPQSIQAGFYHAFDDRWALMGDLTWIDWSRFGRLDISVGSNSTTFKTDYNDLWIGSIGAEYAFDERWKGGLGFSYVSSGIGDGDGEVDQNSESGRLVGKFDRRLSFAFQISFVFGPRPDPAIPGAGR